jgi:hypothetical protein
MESPEKSPFPVFLGMTSNHERKISFMLVVQKWPLGNKMIIFSI